MKKEQIINSAIDLYGYSYNELNEMSYKDLVNYLFDEMPKIIKYNK